MDTLFSPEALATETLSQELHEVLNCVVKCVHLIKPKPLNQRLFSSLCGNMDADHQALLLHTDISAVGVTGACTCL